jgi:hypothetical protein
MKMFTYVFLLDTFEVDFSFILKASFGTQVSLGPSRLVNKNFGTQMALVLGELITF